MLQNLKGLDAAPTLRAGQRVRVSAKRIVFKHVLPTQAAFDPHDCEGVVARVYERNGTPRLVPNREIKVEFSDPKKWFGHFVPGELAAIE